MNIHKTINIIIVALIAITVASGVYAATRAIVPRADTEGSIGTAAKQWGDVYTVNLNTSGAMEIPNATAPTVDAAGELALDTTSDTIRVFGASERVIPYWNEKCFTMASTTWATGFIDIPLWFPAKAVTVTDVYCAVDGGTSIPITFGDGTNDFEAVTCDADGQADDGSIANGTFTANERFQVDLGTVTGAVNYLNACITYSITAD